jgi:hypothetical protein
MAKQKPKKSDAKQAAKRASLTAAKRDIRAKVGRGSAEEQALVTAAKAAGSVLGLGANGGSVGGSRGNATSMANMGTRVRPGPVRPMARR